MTDINDSVNSLPSITTGKGSGTNVEWLPKCDYGGEHITSDYNSNLSRALVYDNNGGERYYKIKKKVSRRTYHANLGPEGHDVPPGVAEEVRQIEDEVDEAAARRRQVGFREEDADEEALGDGGHAEHQQEDEDHRGVAVLQHLPVLWRDKHMKDGGGKETRAAIFI